MESDKLKLYNNFKISSADTDMFSRLRVGSLVNLLIQSAINSADQLGFGFGGLRQQHLFWVLSRMHVKITRPLKWYEEVTVETWPKNVEKLLYIRDYIIRDKTGKEVAKATSAWLAIDLESKRPKKIDGLDAEIFTSLKEKQAISHMPERLSPIDSGESFEFKTTYFDIDLNKHVTSTRYIDWMMDTFSLDFHEKNYPKELVINYNKETMPDEKLKLLKVHNGSSFQFEGLNINSNTNAYRGKLIF